MVELEEVAEVAAMDKGVLSLSTPWDISRVTMAWEREEWECQTDAFMDRRDRPTGA